MISFEGKVILVVDDEKGFREVLADEFQMVGATVLTAENGRNAFEIYKTHKVDAIVSDVRMPDGDGIEFLDSLKLVDARMPLVMLITGFSDLTPESAYEKGAEAIFSKPFSLDELLASVHRALLPSKERWGGPFVQAPSDFEIELKFESMTVAVKARVLSVGRGGMFLEFEGTPPTVGRRVVFRIRASDSAGVAFEGLGVCRWFRRAGTPDLPEGIGVEFLALPEPSLTRFLDFLTAAPPRKAFIPNGSRA